MNYNLKEKIELKRGKLYKNKTHQYLFPSLQINCDRVYTRLRNNFWILGVTIDDSKFQPITKDNYLFIHVDPKGAFKYDKYINTTQALSRFKSSMEYIKTLDCYITDYPRDNEFHTIVINLYSNHLKPVLIQGNYSKLYEQSQIETFFPKSITSGKKELANETYYILNKADSYRKIFQAKVSEEFNSNQEIEPNIELDFPPILKQEIL